MNFLAYLFAVLKGVIYGTTVFFTETITASVDVLDLLALRFLLSAVVFWLLKVTRVAKIKVGVRDLFVRTERTPFLCHLLLTALFEPVLYMMFETVGISRTGSVLAAVILTMSPVFTCVFEVLFLHEHSTHLQRIFLGIGMVGAIYIAICSGGDGGKSTLLGILCLFGATICGPLFGVFSRKSSRHFAPLEVTYVSSMLGALIFNAANIVRHLWQGDIAHYFDPYFVPAYWLGFFVLGVMSTIVATAMNNYAHSRLQVSVMAAFGGVSTLVTVLVGVFIGGERLFYYHYIGFSLILARMIGVSYLSIRRERREKK